VLGRSYFLRQVQVCMSFSHGTGDPTLKRRYETLAIEFAQNISDERDLDPSAATLGDINPKPNSGDTSPYK
jgi:hypothetical protein